MLQKAGDEVDKRVRKVQIAGIAAAGGIMINPNRPQGLLQKPPPLISSVLKMIEDGMTPAEIITSSKGTQVELLNILAALLAKDVILVKK